MSVIDSLKDSFKEKAGSVVESSRSLKNTSLDVLEKSSQSTLESCHFYTRLSLRQLRALTSINDLASLRTYVAETISTTGEIAQHAIENVQKNIALSAELRASVRDSFKGAAKPVAAAVAVKPASAKQKNSAAA